MSEETRQQRRQRQREQLKLGRAKLGAGLSLQPRSFEVIAVAALVKAKLTEAGNACRASEAAGLAQALGEASLAAHPARRAIACAKGCAYCCHGFVGATAPEVFRVAAAVRAKGSEAPPLEAIAAAGAAVRDVKPDDRVGLKRPCALLKHNACSVYASRPLVCRQATSFSLPSCVEEFEGIDRESRIEVSSVHLDHASNAHIVLLGAMRAAGLPTDALELSSATALALAEPDAEARWLAGEDVFASLPRFVRRPPEIERVAGEIAKAISD